MGVAPHEAGQGYDSALDRDRNIGRINVGIPSQLGFNIPLNIAVGFHQTLPCIFASSAPTHSTDRAAAGNPRLGGDDSERLDSRQILHRSRSSLAWGR